MSVTIVVGAQWGDEGKGKIVDMLSQSADVVVRYNGGNNAGHSIMNEFGDFVLHLIPAGIFNPDAFCLIERGVVVHPPSLVDEMNFLESSGVSLGGLRLSPYAHMVMPWHIVEDKESEGGVAIGTTLRGIGPCYKDKAGRWYALRIGDMRNKKNFMRKIYEIYLGKEKELRSRFSGNGAVMPDLETVLVSYMDARERILPFIGDTTTLLHRAIAVKKSVLLEGAQGTLLDVDYGTYPYVTSSNTVSMAAGLITAISPKDVDRIIGVAKAYMTRVGEGPFPTEIQGEANDALRIAGREFGATTGRPRRCGWLDLPLLNYAAQVNHLTEIALTKLDILGMLPEIQVCLGYKHSSKSLALQDMFELETKKPDYGSWKGWGSIEGTRFRDELPDQARAYIKMIERHVGVPIRYISIGGKRKEIISL